MILPIPTLVGLLGIPALGLGLIAGAAAAYFYVPVIGRAVAVALGVGAAAMFAYDAGYNERGSLDKSASLKAQIEVLRANQVVLQQNADDAAKIAADAKEAEIAAEANAQAIQEKVTEYEVELAKRPVPACVLSDADVRGLRNIGSRRPAHHSAKPAAAPDDVRRIGEGP